MDFERYMLKKLRENKASKKSLRESVASELGPEFKEMTEAGENLWDTPYSGWSFYYQTFQDGSAPAAAKLSGSNDFVNASGKKFEINGLAVYGVDPDQDIQKFTVILYFDNREVGIESVEDQSVLEVRKIYDNLVELLSRKDATALTQYIADLVRSGVYVEDSSSGVSISSLLSNYLPKTISYNDIDDSTRDALQERAQGLLNNAIEQLVSYAKADLKVDINFDTAEMLLGINAK